MFCATRLVAHITGFQIILQRSFLASFLVVQAPHIEAGRVLTRFAGLDEHFFCLFEFLAVRGPFHNQENTTVGAAGHIVTITGFDVKI